MRWAIWLRMLARCVGLVCPQLSRAAWAASSASSMSFAFERGISQKVFPVMGVMFSKYWPEAGSTHLPPM